MSINVTEWFPSVNTIGHKVGGKFAGLAIGCASVSEAQSLFQLKDEPEGSEG
jgi:hypothetical protein